MKSNTKAITWDTMKDELDNWQDYYQNKLHVGINEAELICEIYGKSSSAGMHIFLKMGEYKCSTRIKFWHKNYTLLKNSKPGTRFEIESTKAAKPNHPCMIERAVKL